MAAPTIEKPARLRTNIAALGVVQLSNFAIPLITLPYLTRVLGAEAYGKVAFAQVLMTYLVLLTDYGFSWSATRKIAAHRDDRAYISKVFLGTWTVQWLLIVLAAVLATFVVCLSPRLRPDAWFYAAAFSAVVGNVLFPVWLLQGLERLSTVAMLQLASRLVVLLPIFILIKEPDHAVFVPAIHGGGAILGGVLALSWVKRNGLIDWRWPGWRSAVQELCEGFALFGSRLSISFYTALVPLVLGWIAGPVALAHFSLADKLRVAAQALLAPLSQALFPRMSHLFVSDRGAAFKLFERSGQAVLLIAGMASVMLWVLAEKLILVLGGADFLPAAEVLRWMAFLPLIIGLSNLLGVQVMLPNGMTRPFNIILTVSGGISVIIIAPLVHEFAANGAAQAMLLVELLVTGSMAVLLWRRGYLSNQERRKA